MIVHGGPDGLQAIRHDFSTNASPLGPPPALSLALAAADRARYPDPSYAMLRRRLAVAHGVAVERIVPTAGTSEAIRRITLAAKLTGVTTVWVPGPGYGDYAAAARSLGLEPREYASPDQLLSALEAGCGSSLFWLCEPCNPTGESFPATFWPALSRSLARLDDIIAFDRAYEPLRLDGVDPIPETVASRAWQCVSPNKALGLTGVRAGYLIAPIEARQPSVRQHVEALAPSWVLSAEGVALLEHLHTVPTRTWLQDVRSTLAVWSKAQQVALNRLGWTQLPGCVPFWLARPVNDATLPERLRQLREHGIKLRDATSFGLPGWVRVSAQPPASQLALVSAWTRWAPTRPSTMPV